METIKTFEELEQEVLQLKIEFKDSNSELGFKLAKVTDKNKRLRLISEYRDEEANKIRALRKKYLDTAEDDIDRELRLKQLGVAKVLENDFYMCDAKRLEEAKKITRADIEKQIQRSKELEAETHTGEDDKYYRPQNNRGRPKLSPEKAIMQKVDAGGLTTEERLPIIIFGLGGLTKNYRIDDFSRKVNDKKVFTADTLDVLDAVTHKMSNWWRKEIKEGRIPEDFRIGNVEEFMGIVKYCDTEETPDEGFNTVIISDGQIRRSIYKPKWSKSYIQKTIENIGSWTMKGLLPYRFAEDGLVNIPWTGGLAEIGVASKLEQYSRYRSKRKLRGKFGKDAEENVYIVRFIGRWGITYAASVANRKVIVFPERFYRGLSANARIIWRAFCGKEYINPVVININQIAKILDWKEEVVSVRQRVIWIEKIFKELESYWFIERFARHDEKDNNPIHWHIWKRRNWFFKPKQIKEVN
ncbi:hypothetical protein KA005_66695 [bacterium]|nr:hypothetical protein [bacterium]